MTDHMHYVGIVIACLIRWGWRSLAGMVVGAVLVRVAWDWWHAH